MPDPVIELEDSQQGSNGELFTALSAEQLSERNRLLAAVLAGPPRFLHVFHVAGGNLHRRGGFAWQATGQTVEVVPDLPVDLLLGQVTPNPAGLQGAVLRIDRATLDALIADAAMRIMPGPVSSSSR